MRIDKFLKLSRIVKRRTVAQEACQASKVIVNGKEAFNGKVRPTMKAMVESCAEYFDPERVFPAGITVDIK